MMYVIRNKKTQKFVYGTDYRYSPPHQRTSSDSALTFGNLFSAEFEFRQRRMSHSRYEICKAEIKLIDVIPWKTVKKN